MFFKKRIYKTRLSVLTQEMRSIITRIGIILVCVLGFLYLYISNYSVFRGYVRNQVVENRQKIVKEILELDYKISELQKTEFLKKNNVTRSMADIEIKQFLKQKS